MTQLFLDMDGVLADFDRGWELHFGTPFLRDEKGQYIKEDIDWSTIPDDFFRHLPPMEDLEELLSYTTRHNPIVLTGVPKSLTHVPNHKLAWAAQHLGPNIEVRCCYSREKCLHANTGDILIDDWEKYKSLWIKKGGIWITHTNTKSTISQLKALGW